MAYFSEFARRVHLQECPPSLSDLARAMEASWDRLTAYRGIFDPNNPAGGQCYPTSRVVQWFYPGYEVASGEVWTGSSLERHFWNVRDGSDGVDRIDLSWQQFPARSVIRNFDILRLGPADDGQRTRDRCALLLERVLTRLG
ncbi:hypothetical protein [Novosphingobium sp. 9U]|uniref:YunG family protein n=1 Tax=Novosphingobium sp. 9U TaxID=2653158 RepID=UPI0012F43159|nr:hypothetical protein [Novosphingobium sp. 9U]VWX53518.1 conserved hypothetical protein [Novosphingobium sp. 9U]